MYDSLKVVNGDINFNSLGQLEFITGEDAIIQSIEHKLNTVKESLFYNLNYGISLEFGQLKKTEKNQTIIQSAISDALSDDDRIRSAQITDIIDGVITLEITLTDNTVLNINFDNKG
jgi:hypothetical protein